MKPSRFAYARPETIEDAFALLDAHAEFAKVLSGGQSLVPMMNLRLARPDVLVDINSLPGLDGLTVANGMVNIGALTRQATVASSREVADHVPLLTKAMQFVGHPATRNRGTFGGSVAHADPSAEAPAILLALGGEVVARGSSGIRTLDADSFFQSFLTTALRESEILTEVRLRCQPRGARWSFEEVARRHGDFALVGLAVTAEVDHSGFCARARVVFFGIGLTPIRVSEAEDLLVGSSLADPSLAATLERVVAGKVTAWADVHASAEYRREVAGVLARRAVRRLALRGDEA